MKQVDAEKHRHQQASSPPLNNNCASNSPATMFSGLGAAAALTMMTPQQLFAAQHMSALLAGIPMNQLYPQTLFNGWNPTTSPPLHSPGPVSPALSSKSSQASRRTPNHISAANNNNNNVVSSSADRKKSQAVAKKRPASAMKQPTIKADASSPVLESATSPPISPEAPSGAVKDVRDKVFTCGVCSRSFGYKHVLQNHERTHTGEKPFKCPECNKR